MHDIHITRCHTGCWQVRRGRQLIAGRADYVQALEMAQWHARLLGIAPGRICVLLGWPPAADGGRVPAAAWWHPQAYRGGHG